MTGAENSASAQGPEDESARILFEMAKDLAGSPLDPLTAPRDCPEFTEYLAARPDHAREVLVAPVVPALIGGFKSNRFATRQRGQSPDAPPDDYNPPGLSERAIPANPWDSLAKLYEEAELQADEQYPDALFAVQQILADAHTRGVHVRELFVPGTVHHTSYEYFSRLTRLAQDTKTTVVVHTQGNEDGMDVRDFRIIEPPTAESVDSYWQNHNGNDINHREKRINPPPDDEAFDSALRELSFEADTIHGTQALYRRLATLASATPEKLKAELMSTDRNVRQQFIKIFRMAFEDGLVRRHNKAPARVIFAKLGHPEGLNELLHELETRSGEYQQIDNSMMPLGVYARHNPDLLVSFAQQARSIVKNHPSAPDAHKLRTLLGALYHSYSLGAGVFLAEALQPQSDSINREHRNTLYQATAKWMPGYVEIVRAMPDSAQKREVLELVMQGAESRLAEPPPPFGERDLVLVYDTAAEVLLGEGDPKHEQLLRRHMLWFFELSGSLVANTTFAERYLQYRQRYGDIPEISQHIHIKQG